MYQFSVRRGEKAPNARLTKPQIDILRARKEAGATYQELAEETGLSIATIRRAVLGLSYREEDA